MVILSGQVINIRLEDSIPCKDNILAGLKGLGQVTSRNTSNKDLTQQFSATLGAVPGQGRPDQHRHRPGGKGKSPGKAKALEQQLSTVERQSNQQTIILWLETK